MAGKCLQVMSTVVVVAVVVAVLAVTVLPAREPSSGIGMFGAAVAWEPARLSLSISIVGRPSLLPPFLEGLVFFDEEPIRRLSVSRWHFPAKAGLLPLT